MPTCLCGYQKDVRKIQPATITGYITWGCQPKGMGLSTMGVDSSLHVAPGVAISAGDSRVFRQPD